MSINGYGDWSREILKSPPFLLDAHLFAIFEEAAGGVSQTFSGGAGVVIDLEGNGRAQGFYRGAGKSLRSDRLDMTVSIIVDVQEDEITCKRAKAIPAGVPWCPYLWDLEEFDAVAAGVYELARPHAAGLVPGVTAGTHPPLILLDGVEDAGAATVAGSVVTAAATGRISVYYMPLYSVMVTALSEGTTVYPVWTVQLSIEEVEG
jgi:hypothetical protein